MARKNSNAKANIFKWLNNYQQNPEPGNVIQTLRFNKDGQPIVQKHKILREILGFSQLTSDELSRRWFEIEDVETNQTIQRDLSPSTEDSIWIIEGQEDGDDLPELLKKHHLSIPTLKNYCTAPTTPIQPAEEQYEFTSPETMAKNRHISLNDVITKAVSARIYASDLRALETGSNALITKTQIWANGVANKKLSQYDIDKYVRKIEVAREELRSLHVQYRDLRNQLYNLNMKGKKADLKKEITSVDHYWLILKTAVKSNLKKVNSDTEDSDVSLDLDPHGDPYEIKQKLEQGTSKLAEHCADIKDQLKLFPMGGWSGLIEYQIPKSISTQAAEKIKEYQEEMRSTSIALDNIKVMLNDQENLINNINPDIAAIMDRLIEIQKEDQSQEEEEIQPLLDKIKELTDQNDVQSQAMEKLRAEIDQRSSTHDNTFGEDEEKSQMMQIISEQNNTIADLRNNIERNAIKFSSSRAEQTELNEAQQKIEDREKVIKDLQTKVEELIQQDSNTYENMDRKCKEEIKRIKLEHSREIEDLKARASDKVVRPDNADKIADLEQEVRELRKEKEDSERERRRLSNQLTVDKSFASNELNEKEATLTRLGKKIDKLETENNSLATDNDILSRKIKKLKEERLSQENHDEQSKDLARANEMVESLMEGSKTDQETIRKLKIDQAKLEGAIEYADSLVNQCKDLERNLEVVTRERNECQALLHKEKEKRRSLEGDNEALTEAMKVKVDSSPPMLTSLEKRMAKQLEEIKSLRKQHSDQEKLIEFLRSNLVDTRNENKSLLNLLSETQTTADDYQQINTALENRITTLEQSEPSELQDQLSKSQQELQLSYDCVNDLQRTVLSLTQTITDKHRENKQAMKDCEEEKRKLREEIQSQKEEIERLTEHNQAEEENTTPQGSSQEKELKELKKHIEELGKVIYQQEVENQRLKAMHGTHCSKVFDEENDHLQETVASLLQSLEDKENEFKRKEEKYMKVIKDDQGAMQSLQDIIKEQKVEITEAKNRLTRAIEERDVAKRLFEQQNEECKELRKALESSNEVNSRITDLTKAFQDKVREIEELKIENEETQNKLNNWANETSARNTEMTRELATLKQFEIKSGELERRLAQISEENEDLRKKRNEAIEQMSNQVSQETFARLTSQLSRAELEVKNLNLEIERMKVVNRSLIRVEDYTNMLMASNRRDQENRELITERDEARARLIGTVPESSYKELEYTLHQCSGELLTARQQLDILNKAQEASSAQHLVEEVNKKDSELQQMKNQIDQLKNQIHNLTQQNQSLEGQINVSGSQPRLAQTAPMELLQELQDLRKVKMELQAASESSAKVMADQAKQIMDLRVQLNENERPSHSKDNEPYSPSFFQPKPQEDDDEEDEDDDESLYRYERKRGYDETDMPFNLRLQPGEVLTKNEESAQITQGSVPRLIENSAQMVLSNQQIKELSNIKLDHYLNKGCLEQGTKLYSKTIEDLEKTHIKLAGFISVIHRPRLLQALKSQYDNLEKFLADLKDTVQMINNEAKARNINPNQPAADLSKMLPPPKFGDQQEPSHIFDFIKTFKAYATQTKIDLERPGEILKAHLYGKPLRTWSEIYLRQNTYMEVSILDQLEKLKSFYGKTQMILDEIAHNHRVHKFIPEVKREGDKPISYAATRESSAKHLKEANKVVTLLEFKPNALDAESRYVPTLKEMMPEHMRHKLTSNRSDLESFREIHELLTNFVDDLRERERNTSYVNGIPLRDISKESRRDNSKQKKNTKEKRIKEEAYHVYATNSSNQNDNRKSNRSEDRRDSKGNRDNKKNYSQSHHDKDKNGQNRNYRQSGDYSNNPNRHTANVQSISRERNEMKGFRMDDKERPACHMCYKAPGQEGRGQFHYFFGEKKTLPESCPLLRNRSIKDRKSFIESINVCESCLYKDKSQCNNCKFLKGKFGPEYKCSVENCPNRYSLCAQHEKNNYHKLKNLREILSKEQINSSYSLETFTMNREAYNSLFDKMTPEEERIAKEELEFPKDVVLHPSREFMRKEMERNKIPYVTEREGRSSFIFEKFTNPKNNLDFFAVMDPCASGTVVNPNLVGIAFEAAVEEEHGTYHGLKGIGGTAPARALVISLPIKGEKGNDMAEITAVAATGLPVPRYRDHSKEALLMKEACLKNSVFINGFIASPEPNVPVALLMGVKNLNLQPKEVFRSDYGPVLYEGRLRSSEYNKGYNTYCLGGNLTLLKELKKNLNSAALKKHLDDLAIKFHPTPVRDPFPSQYPERPLPEAHIIDWDNHMDGEEDSFFTDQQQMVFDKISGYDDDVDSTAAAFAATLSCEEGAQAKPSSQNSNEHPIPKRRKLNDVLDRDWLNDVNNMNYVFNTVSHQHDDEDEFPDPEAFPTELKVNPILADERCKDI